MREKLSIYKFKKIATESLKNGIRLHFDSITLYQNKSFPSALQLSIIALEEIAKARWVEHYYHSSVTNAGFPDKAFEQQWLKLLYYHPEKQYAFFARDWLIILNRLLISSKLEMMKQKATYVGLEKIKGNINVNSRISIPSKLNSKQAKKYISIINDTLIEFCTYKSFQKSFFSIHEMDSLLTDRLFISLRNWDFKSGVKRNRFFTKFMEKLHPTSNALQ